MSLPIVEVEEGKTHAYECEFTVESVKNLGGATEEKRVTFRGYASNELCETLAMAITRMVEQ